MLLRLLGLLENFLSTVKWLQHNVTYVAKNMEMDLRYITWIDHQRGASFVPAVSQQLSVDSYSYTGVNCMIIIISL